MSYRMIKTARRLMCDKFSVLCTLAELNAKQLREKEPEVDDTMRLNVKIKRLNEDAVIPKYAREGDAGFDLIATEDVIIEPGETKLVPTGLAFELPPGYEMQIRPRSGITLRTKLRVQLGTIDSSYRGEVSVIVDNIAERVNRTGNVLATIDGKTETIYSSARYYDENTYLVRKGDRICQAVISQVEHARFREVSEIEDTERGGGSFGSSGVR